MPTLATTVDGLKLPNPFVIGSGPPGTNLNVINRAFREGWGAVIAKTISLDSSKVVNVAPRYAKLMAADGKEPIGWENIELISDRPFNIWLDEFKKCKDQFPDGILIASIMEEYNKDAWVEIVERCEGAGVDSFELNFSCPHGLPERKMGAAMGENPEIVEEVCGWVMGAAKKPVWAKMTPNVTRITDPSRAAFRGVPFVGAMGEARRATTPSGACGPWRGGASGPGVRSSCSCVRGSRASCGGGCDWAEKCASWITRLAVSGPDRTAEPLMVDGGSKCVNKRGRPSGPPSLVTSPVDRGSRACGIVVRFPCRNRFPPSAAAPPLPGPAER